MTNISVFLMKCHKQNSQATTHIKSECLSRLIVAVLILRLFLMPAAKHDTK